MKSFGFVAVLGMLVVACASSDGDTAAVDPAEAQGEELSTKRCGTFAHGTCPSSYYCDMSSVPAGNVGGSGVCKKGHHCVLNGVFAKCPAGQSFDTAVCHCR